MIGIGAGVVAGALVGAVACGQSDDPGHGCAGDIVKGSLILGALGGLTGLLIGGSIPKAPGGADEASQE